LQLSRHCAKTLLHMALRAIFLDAAGTLFTSVRPIGESYAELARTHGKAVSAQDLARRFRHCHASAPPLAFPGVTGSNLEKLERDWWKELVRRVFQPFAPFERFDDYFAELFDYFRTPAAWSLFDDTRDTLTALRDRRLILCVISNFDSRLFGILDGLGIAPQFNSVFISSQVGVAKPKAGIFQAALSRYGLKPEEALHVGDSLNYDIEGARGAGVEGILLDAEQGGESNCTRIGKLKALLPIIEGMK